MDDKGTLTVLMWVTMPGGTPRRYNQRRVTVLKVHGLTKKEAEKELADFAKANPRVSNCEVVWQAERECLSYPNIHEGFAVKAAK